MKGRLPRATLLALALSAAFALNTPANAQAPPGSLWYNGDWNLVNGLANERDNAVTQAAVYDNFTGPTTAGTMWDVTALFSDNLLSATTVTGADWEIRTGVSEGNAGTLVAHGTTQTPVVAPTGRFVGTEIEYMVEVTGLSIFLPILPSGQFYWLNVTPVNSMGRSYNSTTSGTNCVGTPCGNDQNAFFNSTFLGTYFTSTAFEGVPGDFSNGVIGTVVPEPSFRAMVAIGAVVLIGIQRLRRRKKA